MVESNQASVAETSSNPFSRLRAFLKARPDSEHETTYNRVGIHILVAIFAVTAESLGWVPEGTIRNDLFPDLFITFALCFVIFGHILYSPGENPVRRYVSIVFDVFCIAYTMHLGGEWYLWMYPFLLWAIFGNGFRFGVRYLVVASALSVAAFAILLAYSPFWHKYPALSWGCLAGLITLPAYVSVLIRKLSAAKRQAEESNRAKSAFLASISHELRTPLTAIIGLSDLLKTTPLHREQIEMNETIGEAGRSLLSLINAILDLSRLEVGKMPRKVQDIDLYRLLHRIADMIAVTALAKNVRVQLSFTADTPRVIRSSLKHLEDAIINLASNAVKFTSSGYVSIRVLTDTRSSAKTRLRIEVEDSGIGIAENAQQRIFERFTQADDTIIDKFGGTGLGLATVKQMIEDIGGTVEVRSVLGKGSVFTIQVDVEVAAEAPNPEWKPVRTVLLSGDPRLSQFLEDLSVEYCQYTSVRDVQAYLENETQLSHGTTLVIVDSRICGSDIDGVARTIGPADRVKLLAVVEQDTPVSSRSLVNYVSILQRPLSSDALAACLVMAAGPRPDGDSLDSGTLDSRRAYSIIVADDKKVNLLVISKILTQAGHEVVTVENGAEAVEAMQQKRFDVALFDLNMPIMNGTEAAKLYRFSTHEEYPTPIIALTADATPEAEARCREAGMFACLTKPIEPRKLLKALDNAVEKDHGVYTPSALDKRGDIPAPVHPAGGTNPDNEDLRVDTRAMDDLRSLGGDEFAQEVLEHFVAEASEVLEKIDEAVAALDYMAFREHVHALRSGAANVGARAVFNLCLLWRAIEPAELAANGETYLRELSEALVECTTQLASYCTRVASAAQQPTHEIKSHALPEDVRKTG